MVAKRYSALLSILITIILLAVQPLSVPTISAQTAPPLYNPEALNVIAVTPEVGAMDVSPTNAQIIVTFDHSVVPITSLESETPTLLTFVPAIQGRGKWVHPAVYVFTPAENALKGGMAYQATVNAPLQAVDSTMLAAPYTWSFRIIEPQVITIAPDKQWHGLALLDTNIVVSFSQPMDPTSTEAAFTFTQYIGPICGDGCPPYSPNDWEPKPGRFSWNTTSTQLTFTPAEPLQYQYMLYSQGYSASIGVQAHSASGTAVLASPVSTQFVPVFRPAVASITPDAYKTITPGFRSVTIRFNSAMNPETYRGRYTVSPTPPGEITPYVDEDGTLRLWFEQVVSTDYTITMLPGIEDIYGTPTQQAISAVYRVREPKPKAEVWLTPPNGQYLAIASTSFEQPVVTARIRGNPQIITDIYQANVDTLSELIYREHNWYSYYDSPFDLRHMYEPVYRYLPSGETYYVYPDPPYDRQQDLISRTIKTYSASTTEWKDIELPMHDLYAQKLPMGVYAVEINEEMGFMLAVTNVVLTIKRTSENIMIWVTDDATTQPVPNVSVKIRGAGADTVWLGRTNAEGIAWFDAPNNQSNELLITAQAEDIFGVWYSSEGVSGQPSTTSYMYTDRPIYRPGEPVHYRGILRENDDLTYTIPSTITSVYATVPVPCNYYDYDCEPSNYYEALRPFTSFGTFSDSFTLPDDLEPGSYQINITSCPPESEPCEQTYTASTYFQVAEFRVPDFTVELTPQRGEILSSEPINVDVEAAYYFGSPVTSGDITRTGDGWYRAFEYRGSEQGYTFGDWHSTGRGSINPQTPIVPLQTDGHYLLTDTANSRGSLPIGLGVEATVTDTSGQTISGRTSILVHPANIYLGLRAGTSVTNLTTPVPVDILTIYPDSTPRPREAVRLEVIEKRYVRKEVSFGVYQWEYVETSVSVSHFTTDANAHATYTFTPPHEGYFRLQVSAQDELNRRGQTSLNIYVEGENPDQAYLGDALMYIGGCTYGEPTQYLKLTSDQTSYLPGDTAKIQFQNPYGVPVTALIAVERATIRQTEIISISEPVYTYSLPVSSNDAPNIFVNIVMMRPIIINSPLPSFLKGSLSLKVDNYERRLTVDVTPSTTVAQPGDTVTFDVQVTDNSGNPAIAEVGLALTDEAVLALVYDYRRSFEDYFYPLQDLHVKTSSSAVALLNSPSSGLTSGCGYGGGGGGFTTDLRDDFIYTPLWEPHLVTDQTGHGSVSVTMPDNLTRWQLDTRAITMDTKVGETENTLTTTLPLVVRAIAPRFFIEGDHLPLAAVVHNNTDEPLKITVTLEQTGLTLDDADVVRTVELQPHSLERVEWWGVVQAVDGVYLAVTAVADNGLSDASIPTLTTGENNTIPVYRFSTVENFTSNGVLQAEGNSTEQIDLRLTPAPQTGTLTIQLQASLTDSIVDYALQLTLSLEDSIITDASYLQIYTAALAASETAAPVLNERIQTILTQIVHDQRSNGGWGWYPKVESDPSTTAYVLMSLSEVQASGFEIEARVIDRAAEYLKPFIVTPSVNTSPDELNHQVGLVTALARHDHLQREQLDALYEYRLEMSIAARAQLLLAYLALAPISNQVDTLTTDLTASAILSAGGTHWEEANDYWGGDTQTTAMALFALLKVKPAHPLGANAVRWLMMARHGYIWRTEWENVWAALALSTFTQQMGDTQPEYDFSVILNGGSFWQGSLNTQTASQPFVHTLGLADLLPDQLNTLIIQRSTGEGNLYYSTQLQLTYPADQVDAVQRGIRLEREYINDGDGQRINSVQIGDIVVVRLSLYVSQDMYYFTLEDTLPAGLEPLDPSLLTTTQTAEQPKLRSSDRNSPYWYWGAIYWANTDIHDEGITLQAYFLPRGVYTYTYQARAATPGVFRIPPTVAYAAEQPDVWGRTRADSFFVQNR